MLDEAIDKLEADDKGDAKSLWLAKLSYGEVLVEISDRTKVPDRIEPLEKAIELYNELWTSYEQEETVEEAVKEEDYYSVFSSLGRAENSLARCRQETEYSEFRDAILGFERAIQYLELAADYFAKFSRGEAFLIAFINLGNALKNYGWLVKGDIGNQLLKRSISVFRGVVSKSSPEIDLPGWVSQKRNLATALTYRANLADGAEGVALFVEAKKIYEELVEACPREKTPVLWGEIQFNLSLALFEFADHGATVEPRTLLEAAQEHVLAALAVFDPAQLPDDHQNAIQLLDQIKARLNP